MRKIVFIGNHAYSDQWLKGVIKTSESGWFGFLKTTDVYDPDQIESDRDLLHDFYLKHGFADAQVVAATGAYDATLKGFVVTFTVDEGDRYRLGIIDIQSHLAAAIDRSALASELKMASGDVYDAQAVEKSVEGLTAALGKQGFPFVSVRPHARRDRKAKRLDLVFALEDGPHSYIERIVIRGNTFTRDHVVRREFDITEGDAYNRALVARAERRLKALGLFKSVKTSTAAGSAPDRVVLNVDIEEQQTGDFAIAGGYSTSNGVVAEISISERNFLGLGQFVKVSATVGQYVRGAKLSLAEPYFLDNRMTLGLDIFGNQTLTNANQSYGSTNYGAAVKLAAPITDTLGTEVRYSLVNQSLSLDPALMDCVPPHNCVAASAEVKQAVLDGPAWVSTAGTTFLYSTLDNPKNPHEGLRVEVKQDVAGLGGNVGFLQEHRRCPLLSRLRRRRRRHGPRAERLRDALWRTAVAVRERLFRRPAARARFCAERLRAARSHARHHARQYRRQQILGDDRGAAIADPLAAARYRAQGRGVFRCGKPVGLSRTDVFPDAVPVAATLPTPGRCALRSAPA